MKKYLILTLINVVVFVEAELVLQVTKGSENPHRVAFINFDGPRKLSDDIFATIQNDLSKTGEFTLFKQDNLLSIPKTQNDINFTDLSIQKIDYLIFGDIKIENENDIIVIYDIFSVSKKRKIRNTKVFGIPNKIKQLSHFISDGIYEEITGIRGVASTKLLYVKEITNNNKSIYSLVMSDSDGTNEQTLLRSSEPIISPSWSPDSTKVAYVSFEAGIAQVYIQNIYTGKRTLALENNSQISSPSWSPDGKFLSLTLYRDGNAEIYILNLKNKNLTRLTNHYAIDTESSWSPDGRKILFTSGRSGSPQIYEINLLKKNSKPKRITFEGNYSAKASYLPNGDGIVFVHRYNKNFMISLKYFNENFIRYLTDSELDESPSIAPNGNVVIYAIKENDFGLLAGLTFSGAKFRLPSNQGFVREPAWSGFLR